MSVSTLFLALVFFAVFVIIFCCSVYNVMSAHFCGVWVNPLWSQFAVETEDCILRTSHKYLSNINK